MLRRNHQTIVSAKPTLDRRLQPAICDHWRHEDIKYTIWLRASHIARLLYAAFSVYNKWCVAYYVFFLVR